MELTAGYNVPWLERTFMKTFKTLLVCLVLGGVYFYNTNWFQSFFLYERFNQSIADVPFDVTKNGKTISIPLKYKFNTCYELSVAVPDKNLFHDGIVGPGSLNYRFISRGKVIEKGITFPPARQHTSLYQGVSLINILVFDLPFPGAGDDLTLELTVETPMTFLNEYSETIHCRIRTNYSAKIGGCFDEDLRALN